MSVGVPVYNGEPYLSCALDALLAQTYSDFEIIISDNASTDGTEEIARAYASRDSRVRYVRQPRNAGAAPNYRRTFELSTAEYFRWAAADDVSAPEFLARCVEVLDQEPAVVLAYPKTRFIDEEGRVQSDYDDRLHLQSPRPEERFRQLIDRVAYVNVVFGLMRRDIVRRTRLLGTFVDADIVFLAELSLYGTFWEIPEVLFYRRFHAGASSQMTRSQTRVFYDPDHPRRIYLPQWRHFWEHVRSVGRAPLPLAAKLQLGAFLVRGAVWSRDKLANEILGATRELKDRVLGRAQEV